MTTKSEVAEIQVLTDEQMEALPKDVKKNVLALTKDMRSSELVVLNPLVGRLLSLRERVASLTLEKDEEGNITPESIEEYKALKADQRSFNGDLGREMKNIKAPYTAISKGLVAVEKKFKEISDEEVKAKAEDIFEEYEAEKKRKAEEAQAKKDAEMNAKIAEANKEAEELRKKSEKAEAYNAVKYTEIAEGITNKTIDGIESMNESSLVDLRASITNKNFTDIKSRTGAWNLDEEVITSLENDFEKAKKSAISLIEGKLREYAEEREKLQREARESYSAPATPQHFTAPASIPPPPRPNHDKDEDFVKTVLEAVASLEASVDHRLKERGITPAIVELKHKFLKFNNND